MLSTATRAVFESTLETNKRLIAAVPEQQAFRASLHGRRLIASRIIIIDEASMLHRFHLACLDRTLRHLCRSTVPFAGKLIVLSGDFKQTLPVQVP